jgi:hypothetical protein
MSDKPHTIFMLVKTTTNWIALPTSERFDFLGSTIQPILAAHPTVKMRFYDSEFFNARVSDVVVWETKDLPAFRSLVDRLRETKFWGAYFDIVDIVPAVENAYTETNDAAPIQR